MNAVLTIVRLRWALTMATLRRSPWQTVGFVVSAMLGLGTVIGVGALAWFVGIPFFGGALPRGMVEGNMWITTVLQPAMALVGAMLTLCTALAQMIVIGEGSAMSPRSFAIYGIPDRTLQTGLLLSTLSGIPSIVGILSMMLWSLAYRRAGAVMMLTQMFAGVLAIVSIISIARMLVSLVGTTLHSKRGGNALYIGVMVVLIFTTQLPNMLSSSLQSGAVRLGALTTLAQWLAWTPLSAALQLPFDAASGHWVWFLLRIVVVVLTVALTFAVSLWCMRRDRYAVPPGVTVARVKGAGAFGWMPDSASGAVSARVFTMLRHDPRQVVVLIMPLFFTFVFALQSTQAPGMVWQALIWSGFFMSVTESNGLAYDGQGFAMQAQVGIRGREDRLGRVRVFVTIMTGYLLVLALGILVATGGWSRPSGWSTMLVFLCAGLGVGLAGLGVAEISSCVLLYPVSSINRPFSSPQGRALAQGFMPFVFILATIVVLLPTAGAAILLVVVSYPQWVFGLIGLVNGALVLAGGVWIGGSLLDRRLLHIVSTLDGFASLQR